MQNRTDSRSHSHDEPGRPTATAVSDDEGLRVLLDTPGRATILTAAGARSLAEQLVRAAELVE